MGEETVKEASQALSEKPAAGYGLPIKGLALGVLGIVFNAVIQTIIGPVSGFGPTGETSLMVVIFLGLITAYAKKIRLSWEDYVAIFTMTYAASVANAGAGYFAFPLWLHTDAVSWLNVLKSSNAVPPAFFGPKHLYELAIEGGTSPPWGELLPFAFTGFAYTMLLGLALIFAAAPFRRQIIEVERLPFPVATATYSGVLNLYAVGEEAKAPILGSRRAWVLLGFLVGFLLTAFTQGYLISELSTIWGVNIPVIPSEWDMSHDVWKSWRGAIVAFDFSATFPWGFFSFFFPMEALITIAITSIITWLVIAPAEVNAGMIPSFDMSMSKDDFWFYAFRVEGIKFFFAGVAIIFGAVLAHYVTGLRSLRETWKSNPEEIIKDYRTTAMLALFGILVFLGIGAAFGGNLLVVLFTAIYILFLVNIYYIRTIGEVNMMWGVWAVYFIHTVNFAEAVGAFQRGVEPVTMTLVGSFVPMMMLLYTSAMTGVAYMESNRFAFLARVGPRKVFSALIVGLVLSYFIEFALQAQLNFQFGLNSRYYGQFEWGELILGYPYRVVHRTDIISRWYSLDDVGSASWLGYYGGLLLGFLLTLGRFQLNLPISAIGMGFAVAITPWDWSYTFIPFLIIKWLLLKIGGGRLYERLGVPLFAGAAAGGMFAAFAAGIAAYFRFLYTGG